MSVSQWMPTQRAVTGVTAMAWARRPTTVARSSLCASRPSRASRPSASPTPRARGHRAACPSLSYSTPSARRPPVTVARNSRCASRASCPSRASRASRSVRIADAAGSRCVVHLVPLARPHRQPHRSDIRTSRPLSIALVLDAFGVEASADDACVHREAGVEELGLHLPRRPARYSRLGIRSRGAWCGTGSPHTTASASNTGPPICPMRLGRRGLDERARVAVPAPRRPSADHPREHSLQGKHRQRQPTPGAR